jgi:hypothetical protein
VTHPRPLLLHKRPKASSLAGWLWGLVWLMFLSVWALPAPAAMIEESTLWKAGELNLQSVHWGDAQIFALDGEWRLMPGQWLPPDASAATWENSLQVTVPGFWNETSPDAVPTFGIATLARRIRVPANTPLFLALSDIPSAYRLYINGELRETVGQPGHSPEDEVPQFGAVCN